MVDFGALKSLRAFPPDRSPRNAERGPGSRTEGQLNWLMKRIQRDLKLTDKQAATVESAFKASREEMKLTFEELRPRMRDSTEKLKEKLRGDLTEEQLAKFEKYLGPKASRDHRGPGGRSGSGFRKGKNGDNRPRRPGIRSEHPPGPPSP